MFEGLGAALSGAGNGFAMLSPVLAIAFFFLVLMFYVYYRGFYYNCRVKLVDHKGNEIITRGRQYRSKGERGFSIMGRYSSEQPPDDRFFYVERGPFMAHRTVTGVLDQHGNIHWAQPNVVKATVKRNVVDKKTGKTSIEEKQGAVYELNVLREVDVSAHLSSIERAHRKNILTPDAVLTKMMWMMIIVVVICAISTGWNAFQNKKASDNIAFSSAATRDVISKNNDIIAGVGRLLSSRLGNETAQNLPPQAAADTTVITPFGNTQG